LQVIWSCPNFQAEKFGWRAIAYSLNGVLCGCSKWVINVKLFQRNIDKWKKQNASELYIYIRKMVRKHAISVYYYEKKHGKDKLKKQWNIETYLQGMFLGVEGCDRTVCEWVPLF
jgi:hypothetical protein